MRTPTSFSAARELSPGVLRRFYPDGASTAGFLAPGEDLHQVLRADAETISRVGADAHELGLALKELLDRYHQIIQPGTIPYDLDRDEEAARIAAALAEGGLLPHVVQVQTWRGFQTCPFPDCIYEHDVCPHSYTDWTITNRATGKTASGPGLLWHLVADHGFFEGLGSPYRVDPEVLADLLSPAGPTRA